MPVVLALAAPGAAWAQAACGDVDQFNTISCTVTQSAQTVGTSTVLVDVGDGVNVNVLNTAPGLGAQGPNASALFVFSHGPTDTPGGFIDVGSFSALMSTDGQYAPALQLLSIGGGGANGANGSLGGGGDGDAGGDGGAIGLQGAGLVGTNQILSPAVQAVSIGGSGGSGGDGGLLGGAGNGGNGGAGGGMLLSGNWNIGTGGFLSDGIHAASLAGTAGNSGGGFLFTGAGTGGGGAAGGAVTVDFFSTKVGDGKILTLATGSNGIFAQSVGGFSGSAGSGGYFVPTGGNALSGGPGGAVTVQTTDKAGTGGIETRAAYSTAIFAQSVGGGGGSAGAAGGLGIIGGLLTGAEGASGGAGGDGGLVAIGNQMKLTTAGDYSRGLFAQSIGGGGGDGGSAAGLVAYGGSGAGGGVGGEVGVNNGAAIATGTFKYILVNGHSVLDHEGLQSDGIFAQSVGGGGGNGGNSLGILSFGGTGASGGWGGDVGVFNRGAITTLGDQARGIFAQSIGGGGGDGGDALGLIALGGSGASSVVQSYGGAVTIANSGAVSTLGIQSDALFAQSIGGGGGRGGDAGGLISFGGSAGSGGPGGAVTVANSGQLTATGTLARGILAQSIGGGGGAAGRAVGAVSFGDSGGGGGAGGAVGVSDTTFAAIASVGSSLVAQSIGGGAYAGSAFLGIAYGG